MREIELYVHIPFCVKKCNYCDFLSAPCDAITKERYVDALCKEILSSGSLLQEYEVTTIFFGGGTPSLLSAEQIRNVMQAIKKVAKLSEGCEITMECNPGTINEELLLTYHNLGINRLSFGLQSTDSEELKMLGRIHSYEDFVNNYELARRLGFHNISVDLMSALPKQTLTSYEDTLYKVIALQPEHISAYSLIIEEGTKFWSLYGDNGSKQNELPSVELDRRMYERSKEILEDAGYLRYEISNYAKPSYECRHNIGYWNKTEYLSFGLGAASMYQNQRFSNVSELKEYIDKTTQGLRCWEDIHSLDEKEAMEEFMFLGLRLCEGVSKLKFFQSFNITMEQIYGEVLIKLSQENLIIEEAGFIKLTAYGVDVSNAVLAEFLFE